MNNFAGPPDANNFPHSDNGQYEEDGDGTDETPFMGNHIVKTVRNLRMR